MAKQVSPTDKYKPIFVKRTLIGLILGPIIFKKSPQKFFPDTMAYSTMVPSLYSRALNF